MKILGCDCSKNYTVSRKKDKHCFIYNFYKFKPIVLIFGKQHRGCITKTIIVTNVHLT